MTSRIFVVRQEETDWSLDHKHTESTDIPLTANSERQAKATAETFVGEQLFYEDLTVEEVRNLRKSRNLDWIIIGTGISGGTGARVESKHFDDWGKSITN